MTGQPIPAQVVDAVMRAIASNDLTILDQLTDYERKLAQEYLNRMITYIRAGAPR